MKRMKENIQNSPSSQVAGIEGPSGEVIRLTAALSMTDPMNQRFRFLFNSGLHDFTGMEKS